MRTLILFGVVLVWTTSTIFGQRYRKMMEAGTYPLEEIQREAESYFDIVGHGQGTGYKQYKRWEYVASMELDERGIKIPNHELAQQARALRRSAEAERQESGNFSGDWRSLGPTYWNATKSWNPGVGRITSIGIDPLNTDHIIVGSPTGGIWRTLDGGLTWSPLTDDFSTVDVYALEISPWNSNDYLWGSTHGRIYRSIDGGSTWTATNNVSGSGQVIRIQHHPVHPNVVYAVSESNGLFRSTDGGTTWSPVAGVSGSNIDGYDIEFKPDDPSVIYFSGTRFYRSTDGGVSFQEIGGFNTSGTACKMIAVTPANPNRVYVLESRDDVFGGFYRSDNSGSSFTKFVDGDTINYFGYSATGSDSYGQAPRDMDVAAHPFHADQVHIAGINMWKSINGGQSFSLTAHWVPKTAASLGVGYVHADVDILRFVGNRLYVGTDGGFFISDDGAGTFVNRTDGLCIREFYRIGVSKTNPDVVTGGSQDNGTSVMRGIDRFWFDWLGADGMETFVDWSNDKILYGTTQNGSMYRSNDQGDSYVSIMKPPGVGNGAWITPFEQDPQVPTTVYVAFADIWRSTTGGGNWVKISNFNDGSFMHLKIAPTNNQRLYAARGARLFTTSDGGQSWVEITERPWGKNTYINFIAVHPQWAERLLVVTAHAVYHSTNAGLTWENITSGLPSGTKYCAAWEDTGKNGIYIGGFGFVSYTNDDLSGKWIGFFKGLPNVRVYELEINYVSGTIFAGTYGRGLWESPLYHFPSSSVPVVAGRVSARLFPNPARERIWLELRTDAPLEARLELFTLQGNLIGTLAQGSWPTGQTVHEVVLPPLPAGVYLYRLATEAGTTQGRLWIP